MRRKTDRHIEKKDRQTYLERQAKRELEIEKKRQLPLKLVYV